MNEEMWKRFLTLHLYLSTTIDMIFPTKIFATQKFKFAPKIIEILCAMLEWSDLYTKSFYPPLLRMRSFQLGMLFI